MKTEIAEAFAQIVKEKNIEKEVLEEIIESIVLSMIKKKYGHADNFDIFVNLDKGEIEIYQNKTVVENVTDPVKEIDLESARKVEPSLEIGDPYLEIIDPASFGRRLIISAKQNLNQRIRDVEKENVYEEYSKKIGEIVIGDIRQISHGDVFINIDKTEVKLPKSEQIPSERYHRGETIRAIVKEVRRTPKGPEIIVSRADPQMLYKLFENEVPEIYDGIIEIKGIVREPGERAKIAVLSNDKRIDAVGACVGMKGMRIQGVSKELNNEKIDIIPFSNEPTVFITRALSPAKPVRVLVDEDKKSAVAVVPDSQISIAIGKGGVNRKLTSRLTGYNVEILRESEYRDMVQSAKEKEMTLEQLDGLKPNIIKKLEEHGIFTVRDILERGKEGLLEIPGIGPKTADKIWDLVS